MQVGRYSSLRGVPFFIGQLLERKPMSDATPVEAQQGQPQTPVAPSQPVEGQAPKEQVAPSETKFDGKTPDEIYKSYKELEKKLGDQSKEIGDYRKLQDDFKVVAEAINSDPLLYRAVDEKIRGGQPQSQTETPTVDVDNRRATEQIILNDFKKQFGIDKLPVEKQNESLGKIVNVVAELVDPAGKKPIREVLDTIPLDKLSRYLENGFYVANKDEYAEKVKLEALARSREADQGAIGSFSSSGVNSDTVSLTPEEKETAKKLGIPEDKYLLRKKEIVTKE